MSVAVFVMSERLMSNMGPIANSNQNSGSFIPADYVRERVELRANAMNLLLFVVVMAGVAGAFLVTHRQWNSVKDQQKVINSQYLAETEKIDQIKKLETQRGEMLDKAEMTALLLEKVPRSVLMAELVNRLPERATVSEMQLKSRRIVETPPKPKPGSAEAKSLSASKAAAAAAEKQADGKAETKVPLVRPPKMEYAILITGFAAGDADVADFHRALKESPIFERVDLVSSLQVKLDELLLRKFRIEAQVKPNADAKLFVPIAAKRMDLGSPRSLGSAPDPAVFMEVPGP